MYKDNAKTYKEFLEISRNFDIFDDVKVGRPKANTKHENNCLNEQEWFWEQKWLEPKQQQS